MRNPHGCSSFFSGSSSDHQIHHLLHHRHHLVHHKNKLPRLHLHQSSSDRTFPARSPFDSLPNDLLLSVVSFLASSASSPTHLINAMLVCKRFCAAATHPSVLAVVSPPALAVKARGWSDGAQRFLQRCADAGNAEAAYILGMIRFYCLKEMEEGAALMVEAAMKGENAEALHSLAIIHFNGSGDIGEGRRRSLRCGAALCARAAALGHVRAMRELGHCLQDGFGVKKNAEEGRRLIAEASAREAIGAVAAPPACCARAGGAAGKQEDEERRRRRLQMWTMCRQAAEERRGEVHPTNRFLVEWFSEAAAPANVAAPPPSRKVAMCCNAGCGRVETRRLQFRQCSACSAVIYCSRSCQSLDWTRRHKLQCSSPHPFLHQPPRHAHPS